MGSIGVEFWWGFGTCLAVCLMVGLGFVLYPVFCAVRDNAWEKKFNAEMRNRQQKHDLRIEEANKALDLLIAKTAPKGWHV